MEMNEGFNPALSSADGKFPTAIPFNCGAIAPPLRPVDPDDGLASLLLSDLPDPPARHADCRKPALEVDTRSLIVHVVNAVEVKTTTFEVDRNRHDALPRRC